MKKSYVWTLPTRIFHIILIISTFISYLLSDIDSLLNLHASFGYVVGFLFIFRILWGFMDIPYSSFKDFNFNIEDLKYYLKNVLFEKKKYLGHNPASSWAIVMMIGLGILAVFTGMLAYGSEESKGLFSGLGSFGIFEDLHELSSNLFMIVVLTHIAGVLFDNYYHKSNVINSMKDGYKGEGYNNVKLTFLQSSFAYIWIAASLVLFVYTSFNF